MSNEDIRHRIKSAILFNIFLYQCMLNPKVSFKIAFGSDDYFEGKKDKVENNLLMLMSLKRNRSLDVNYLTITWDFRNVLQNI